MCKEYTITPVKSNIKQLLEDNDITVNTTRLTTGQLKIVINKLTMVMDQPLSNTNGYTRHDG